MAKPRKVQEPAGTYKSSPSNAARTGDKSQRSSREIRQADPEAVRRAAKKVFDTHHELFRKLAQ